MTKAQRVQISFNLNQQKHTGSNRSYAYAKHLCETLGGHITRPIKPSDDVVSVYGKLCGDVYQFDDASQVAIVYGGVPKPLI